VYRSFLRTDVLATKSTNGNASPEIYLHSVCHNDPTTLSVPLPRNTESYPQKGLRGRYKKVDMQGNHLIDKMKLSLVSLLSLLPFFVRLTRGADVNYNFDIVNANVAPDGYTRAGVLVNGVFPGTLIQAQKSDTLHITVNNQLTNPNMR
jgi:hypothetical protein